MAGLTTQVVPLDRGGGEALAEALDEAGFISHEVAHARFAAKGEGVNVVYYASGKLVLQGRELREFLERWLPEAVPKPPELKDAMIGADEAGKGDYFGPLVTAAVYLEPDVARFLDEVPLRDSKTLSAAEIETGAEMLRRVVPHEIVAIGRPVVIGTSRKSFVGKLAGGRDEGERLPGTIATNVLALERGATVFRVHDVAQNADALRVAAATFRLDVGEGAR